MPDIAKCKGDGCSVKEMCFRYTSKSSIRQSYFITPPFVEKDGRQECDLYWESRYTQDSDTSKSFRKNENNNL